MLGTQRHLLSFEMHVLKSFMAENDAIARASQPESIAPSALQGKRVVFTGTLSTMTRNEAKLLLCDVGGYPQNTFGPSTDYLVMGETNLAVVDHRTGTSSKFRKAQKQGIPILSETEFMTMVYL